MFRKIFISLFVLVTFFSLNCFANQQCSIERIENNKAYLKGGSVQIAKNGIFIYAQGQLVKIDHLEMDEQGVYFDCSKFYTASNCPGCGLPLILGLICTNPECRFCPWGD